MTKKADNEGMDLSPDDFEYLLYIFVCSDKDTREKLEIAKSLLHTTSFSIEDISKNTELSL